MKKNYNFAKISLLLLFLFAMTSCSQKIDIIGKWRGTAILLEVEYIFNSDYSFTQVSYSANGVIVGGGTGTYESLDDEIYLTYEKSYNYNTTLQQGSWIDVSKTITFNFANVGEELHLITRDKKVTIKLKKVTG